MQTALIFTTCFLLFNWIICRIGFIKNAGLNNWWIVGLFSLKVLAGLAYGLFYLQPQYFATSDTWHFFELSKGETDWLLHDPAAFFKDIFVYGYDRSGNLFVGENSYWNDLKSNIIIKLLALCNLVTFKNYYADVVLFNFFFFFGPIALYRVVAKHFNINKLLIIASVFLIPSFIFWCSGIHKDGLIFTCIAVIVYYFDRQLTEKRFMPKAAISMLLMFIILFALRNFMALILAGSLMVWVLCNIFPRRHIVVISFVIVTVISLFFLSGKLSNTTDLPQYVIEKQAEFKKLSGASGINVPPLENSITSFAGFLPTALDIALLRPHISEIKNKSYIPAVAEIYLCWAVVLLSLFVKTNNSYSNYQSSFLVFCLFFSLSFLLLAGYTITFSGAIVRYKASVLPFIFMPVVYKLHYLLMRFGKKI